MPRGDRTGPKGKGPMTGRQLGFCTNNNRKSEAFSQFGGVFGSGRGMGFRKFMQELFEPFLENNSYETEVENLYRQAKNLKEALLQVEKRLSQLEKEPTGKKE